MQSKQTRSNPSLCIVIPNSSSALILLWLFLHLHLLVFFSTSLCACWWNWNGWCWTNTKDGSTHHMWNFICQHVCELVFGVKKFWFESWSPNWFHQTFNQEQLCGFWKKVSCPTSFLYDHLDHCFVAFKYIQHSFPTRRIDVWRNKINIIQIINHSMRFASALEM